MSLLSFSLLHVGVLGSTGGWVDNPLGFCHQEESVENYKQAIKMIEEEYSTTGCHEKLELLDKVAMDAYVNIAKVKSVQQDREQLRGILMGAAQILDTRPIEDVEARIDVYGTLAQLKEDDEDWDGMQCRGTSRGQHNYLHAVSPCPRGFPGPLGTGGGGLRAVRVPSCAGKFYCTIGVHRLFPIICLLLNYR